MKYKIGDKVRIKSLDWYYDNRDDRNDVECDNDYFIADMAEYCGKIVTISSVLSTRYYIKEDNGIFNWTDEMIEGLIEEETTSNNIIKKLNIPEDNIKNILICPEGYIFKDENDNIINATKIILEKKKKEYPKTYKECYKIMDIDDGLLIDSWDIDFWKRNLLTFIQKLLIARDAYWRIAGEEMGLGKPWNPSDSDYITERYCIFVNRGNILCDTPAQDCFLTFPTEEMRDTFYENFKSEIEICKELL